MAKRSTDRVREDVWVTTSWHGEVAFTNRIASRTSFRTGRELPSVPGLSDGVVLVSRTRSETFVHVPEGTWVRTERMVDGAVHPLGSTPRYAELGTNGRPREVILHLGQKRVASGERVVLVLADGALEVSVEASGAVAKLASGLGTWLPSPLFVGVGLLYALAVLGIGHGLSKLGGTAAEPISREDVLFMRKLLDAKAEREKEADEPTPIVFSEDPGTRGVVAGQGAASASKGGRPGLSLPRKGEGIVTATRDAASRRTELTLAGEFGMVGLLASGSASDPRAPTSAWARAESSGSPAGTLFGSETWGSGGDLFGLVPSAGLDGLGGGGPGAGIALGRVGTFGKSDSGGGFGCGCGAGSSGAYGRAHSPSLFGLRFVEGNPSVSGRLPPEAVQRVVRANAGRYRACYEAGLARDPSLEGRVTVKFVIDRSGAVGVAQDGGSDLRDAGVVACVVRAVLGLSFPTPEGGVVTVTYPLVFSNT